MDYWTQYSKYESILEQGHTSHIVEHPYSPRKGSHDDGFSTGLFLGGIGTPVVSRDLTGFFSRWHLQNGYHVNETIDSAFLSVYWKQGKKSGYSRLDESWKGMRKVSSLFPVTTEHYAGTEIPFELILEFFSPLIKDNTEAQTLPLWYITASVKNTTSVPLELSILYCMPHLLGWKVQQITSVERTNNSWPSQTHAGNTAFDIEEITSLNSIPYSGALQSRNIERPVTDEMEGEIALLSFGSMKQTVSREVCFKAGQNMIDRKSEDQEHTIAYMEHSFRQSGTLPSTGLSWTSHPDEALCSAITRSTTIEGNESDRLSFITVFDLPLVKFGVGRIWKRVYTSRFGDKGRNAKRIAEYGIDHYEEYREEIHNWQTFFVNKHPLNSVLLNELYFMNGGGSVWVEGEKVQLEKGFSSPVLGSGEHVALLEGYDVGYYYYNTSDLWYYAWYGLTYFNKKAAHIVWNDYLKSIDLSLMRKRIIYRTAVEGMMLTPHKVPHDVGSPMEDPWCELNGYQMRDDSNLWKDHNSGFIITYYLYLKMTHQIITKEAWNTIKGAAKQLLTFSPLPFHDEFGDTTWDNLGIEGFASFSGGLYLASLASLSSWADEVGETENALLYREKLAIGEKAYVETLFNGEFFKVSDRGTYSECTMADSILGLYYAHCAQLESEFSLISQDMITQHLKSVYQNNFLNFKQGSLGPLLIAEKANTSFKGDGGDELQVNEVLLGSAWLFVAMLDYYDMKEESEEVAVALKHLIYEDSGLQFRTPAAVNGKREFRAPMNMRPLSIWLLDMNKNITLNKEGKIV